MTTGPDNREQPDIAKLDADERDLAARLARIGPFDGPSPSLDAKILAAAHAAAATRKPNRRGHWLAWIGVPPAMVTGVGVAAAAVLALGLVWQLRPRTTVWPAGDEAAAGSGEEVFIAAEPAPATARARRQSAAVRRHRRAPLLRPQPRPKQAPTLARAQAEKAAALPTPRSPPTLRRRRPPWRHLLWKSRAADAPVAQQCRVEPARLRCRTPAGAPHANGTQARDLHQRCPRDGRTSRAAPLLLPRRHLRLRRPLPSKTAPRSIGIEVTGSRLKRGDAESYEPLSKVSVNEDVRLESGEWLERIRARRDEGDLDGARASLRLFRRDHPRVRIPDDLRVLLADPKQ